MKSLLVLFLLALVGVCHGAEPETRISERDGMRQIRIPASEFIMGVKSADAHGRTAEFPPHRVRLKSYWIDEHEVTNAQYAAFLNAVVKGSLGRIYAYVDLANEYGGLVYDETTKLVKVRKGCAELPVCAVSRTGAVNYAIHVGRRLPTEAEWELAARGTDQRRYPWGNDWDRKRTATGENGHSRPVAVGTTPGDRSPFGVRDMGGNVMEWVQDTWQSDFYLTSPVDNPVCSKPLRRGVLRGGAWCLTEWDCRSTSRKRQVPSSCRRYAGFRCAESALETLPAAVPVGKEVSFYASMDGTVHAAASKGRRHALTVHGETEFVPGHRGQAALLGEENGVRHWVDYATKDNLDLKEGTISMWVQPVGWKGSDPGFRYFFMLLDPDIARFYLYRFTSGGVMTIAGNGTNGQWHTIRKDCSDWKRGEWRHLAITWDSASLCFYMNGALVGQAKRLAKFDFRGTPPLFSIGQSLNWDGSKKVVRGQTAIDEVVIRSRALSAKEIQEDRERNGLP